MRGVDTDWRRYAGVWYEQARVPSWFEPATFANVTAEYVPRPDGSFSVINRAEDASGFLGPVVARGMAQVDSSRPGTLNVTFVAPFSAPYVVIARGDQYDWAVVGSPSRNYLWLLTRQPILDPRSPLWRKLTEVAAAAGYPPDALARIQRTPRTAPTTMETTTRSGGVAGHVAKRVAGRVARHDGVGAWVGNVERATRRNRDFRRVVRTGTRQQLVLMSLPPRSDIGLEVHPHVDQFLRIETGTGRFDSGPSRTRIRSRRVRANSAMLVPAGTWHNLTNTSADRPLKLYSLYAPPEHRPGLRQPRKP